MSLPQISTNWRIIILASVLLVTIVSYNYYSSKSFPVHIDFAHLNENFLSSVNSRKSNISTHRIIMEITTQNNPPYEVTIRKIINPSYSVNQNSLMTARNLYKEITSLDDGSKKENLKQKLFTVMSEIVQEQLAVMENTENCADLNLICGHQDVCGLGCQFHHRIACVMISYALGIPLIHDTRNWPYSNKWNDAFLPIGSKCKAGPQSYRLRWDRPFPVIFKEKGQVYNITGKRVKEHEKHADQIEYPLKAGLPVSNEFAEFVEEFHPFPFLWWVGQFMKYGLRLSQPQQNRIQEAKDEIGYENPIVGFHVRRTDKTVRKADKAFLHAVEDYMVVADEYYKNTSKIHGDKESLPRNIFIASDDASLLNLTLQIYSPEKWNIVGFQSRETYAIQKKRANTLYEVVADLILLADSDFVVCGLSSNMCGVLLAMLNSLHLDGMDRLKSLDEVYEYKLLGSRPPLEIVKVL